MINHGYFSLLIFHLFHYFGVIILLLQWVYKPSEVLDRYEKFNGLNQGFICVYLHIEFCRSQGLTTEELKMFENGFISRGIEENVDENVVDTTAIILDSSTLTEKEIKALEAQKLIKRANELKAKQILTLTEYRELYETGLMDFSLLKSPLSIEPNSITNKRNTYSEYFTGEKILQVIDVLKKFSVQMSKDLEGLTMNKYVVWVTDDKGDKHYIQTVGQGYNPLTFAEIFEELENSMNYDKVDWSKSKLILTNKNRVYLEMQDKDTNRNSQLGDYNSIVKLNTSLETGYGTHIEAGLMRLVCTNGLWSSLFSNVKSIRLSGDVSDKFKKVTIETLGLVDELQSLYKLKEDYPDFRKKTKNLLGERKADDYDEWYQKEINENHSPMFSNIQAYTRVVSNSGYKYNSIEQKQSEYREKIHIPLMKQIKAKV